MNDTPETLQNIINILCFVVQDRNDNELVRIESAKFLGKIGSYETRIPLCRENRQQIIDTLTVIARNSHDTEQIRLTAIKSLGKIGGREAEVALCQIVQDKANTIIIRKVAIDALSIIIISQPISTMPDTPKYDLRGANIGNFADTVRGDQISTQNIHLAEEKNLDKILAEIQSILNELKQKYPTATEEQTAIIIDAEFAEIKQKQPWRWKNLLNLKRLHNGSKTAAIKIGEHFAEDSVWG